MGSKLPSATGSSSNSDGHPFTSSREQDGDVKLPAALTQIQLADKTANEFAYKSHEVSTTSNFPEAISCRKAFDDMYYCYSLGGQFLNGELYS